MFLSFYVTRPILKWVWISPLKSTFQLNGLLPTAEKSLYLAQKNCALHDSLQKERNVEVVTPKKCEHTRSLK